MIHINTIADYNRVARLGFEPLCDLRFTLPITLRLEIQGGLFCSPSPETDVLFYKWTFRVKPNFCEETGQALTYGARHVSHILSRGAHPGLRYDGRNFNLLMPWVHTIWDSGGTIQKKGLLIWARNKIIITLLAQDYELTL